MTTTAPTDAVEAAPVEVHPPSSRAVQPGDQLLVIAYGVPAAQGSKRVVGGRLVEASARTRPWRDTVQAAAHDARAAAGWACTDGPVSAECTFTMRRPGAHYGTGRNAAAVKAAAPAWPHRLPDVDKLARAVLDALTAAGVWTDDARVVELVARKAWAGESIDALDVPGVLVRVTALAPALGAPIRAQER